MTQYSIVHLVCKVLIQDIYYFLHTGKAKKERLWLVDGLRQKNTSDLHVAFIFNDIEKLVGDMSQEIFWWHIQKVGWNELHKSMRRIFLKDGTGKKSPRPDFDGGANSFAGTEWTIRTYAVERSEQGV